MRDKYLKPATIIPPHLYAKRDADRQLMKVLHDMGRPGYVLVSRQMGKTNLLLNAKRELESKDTIFTYIDLSRQNSSLQECYRSIVDTTIDTHEELFPLIKNEIETDRLNQILSAQKEYEVELLKLLKIFKGKIHRCPVKTTFPVWAHPEQLRAVQVSV